MGCDYLVSVVGAAIVIVPESDGRVAHDDLVNSVLLAQLVANKEVEKNSEVNWYNAYVKVLDDFWLRQTKAREERLITENCGESMIEWVAAAMSKGAPDEGQATATTLARVASVLGTEPAMSLLRSHVQKTSADELTEVPAPAKVVRLLVILARTPSSVISVYLEFKTRKEISPNPLAQLLQAEDVEGTVSMRYARAYLSETLYGPARDAIALKIREKLKGNIAMLSLTDGSSSVHVPEAIES
ncbi:hypothetical protein [Pseudomonas sp. B21-048]|uniref:hypothetical protein n=1 Tax=Pseudomonas sp. B21-048 TaxID=2895490 RepID=UPI00216057D0|nr:hypothetical protein [Pseudomonas sp. B21-048]UVK99386.1 hypothetical protein LOY56_02930 [Pseudomonas sp. B21-048]